MSDFSVSLIGKIMCYAIVALHMDLIWGAPGHPRLRLFALGGYAFGMYLMRSIGLDGVYKSPLADFMVFLDWKAYPWYWSFTNHFWYSALLVVLMPGLLAFVFGYFAFRSRIKGVYFSIIAGDDLRLHAAVFPQRHRLRGQRRLHGLRAHPRLPDLHAADAHDALRAFQGALHWSTLLLGDGSLVEAGRVHLPSATPGRRI